MKTPAAVAACVLLIGTGSAQAHLVRTMHRAESRAQLHAAAYHDYRHSLYVCARGWGHPKRKHCRALPWLRHMLAVTEPLPAVDITPWIPTLRCETGGTMNWHTNTGNGYFGGLQFDHDTWAGHGGSVFSYNADGAAPWQQVLVADRLDYDGWPNCPNP
jgi:hypothetical protein